MQRRVRTAALLLLLLFASGVLGYKLVGGAEHTWLDAIYMATITLTTTGMRDVIPTNTPLAETFTIGYLLFGATAAVYTLSTITAFIVEGDLTKGFRRRRMQATIDAMRGHFIVCGAGQTGTAVLRELWNTQRRCVAVEQNHQHIAAAERDFQGLPVLHGDCSDDETLTRAGHFPHLQAPDDLAALALGLAAGATFSLSDTATNLGAAAAAAAAHLQPRGFPGLHPRRQQHGRHDRSSAASPAAYPGPGPAIPGSSTRPTRYRRRSSASPAMEGGKTLRNTAAAPATRATAQRSACT